MSRTQIDVQFAAQRIASGDSAAVVAVAVSSRCPVRWSVRPGRVTKWHGIDFDLVGTTWRTNWMHLPLRCGIWLRLEEAPWIDRFVSGRIPPSDFCAGCRYALNAAFDDEASEREWKIAQGEAA